MNGKRKRILILGNGFDLAHFLPTKYEHFITAMRAIEEGLSNEPLSFDNIFRELLIEDDFFLKKTKEIYKTEEVSISIENLIILKEKLFSNGWFQYFKDYLDSGIDTWIDFENEIKNVLDIICSVLDKNSDKNEIIDTQYYGSNLRIISEEFFEGFNTNKTHYLNVLTKLNILQEIYVLHHDNEIIEIEESQFNNIDDKNAHDPITGLGKLNYPSKKMCLKEDFVKVYKHQMTGIQVYKVIKNINDQLLDFTNIFSMYIELVETLIPRINLKKPKSIRGLDSIYSFNYSSTTSRLYNREHKNFLHGKAGENDIVLGVSELDNQLLIDGKAYGFVKYYQKLVNDTNYKFLSSNYDLRRLEENVINETKYTDSQPYEIYVWGHSLDSSDSDYIKEIFSFNKGNRVSIYLIVYYFSSPHAQLANLISIMGKEIIEIWMKKGWLEFVESPNIYALNYTDNYIDKLSKYSEKIEENYSVFNK